MPKDNNKKTEEMKNERPAPLRDKNGHFVSAKKTDKTANNCYKAAKTERSCVKKDAAKPAAKSAEKSDEKSDEKKSESAEKMLTELAKIAVDSLTKGMEAIENTPQFSLKDVDQMLKRQEEKINERSVKAAYIVHRAFLKGERVKAFCLGAAAASLVCAAAHLVIKFCF